ncbi:MAG: hypothetical protein RR406_00430 [Bacilli bacterium]
MTGLGMNETVFWNSGQKSYELCWDFNIALNTSTLSDDDLSSIKEALTKDDNAVSIDKIWKDNQIRVRYSMLFKVPDGTNVTNGAGGVICTLITGSDGTSNTNTDTLKFESSDFDFSALSQIEKAMEDEEGEEDEEGGDINGNEYNKAVDFYVRDYKNPANMPFVPYLEDVRVNVLSSNMSNTFTDISLKAVEGVGPQFLGGTDSTIEIQLMTDDLVVVSMLNQLPIMASATSKKYRRVLPAWPLKIKSEFTGLISVSEVLIDAIEIDTVDGYPGVYSISMRLTSVDRTQRQREALRRLDVKPFGGDVDLQSSNLAIKKYFAVETALSQAELYPDLDLPTIEEMAKLGWRFVKYTGDNRTYPDPDFYITYAYPYSSLIIKKSVKDVISKQILNSKDGKEDLHSFKFNDVLGVELTGKIEATFGMSVNDDNDNAQEYQAILDNHAEVAKTKAENSR